MRERFGWLLVLLLGSSTVDASAEQPPMHALVTERIGSNDFRAPTDVTSVLFTADGSTIIGTTTEGGVCAWDVTTGRRLWITKPGLARQLHSRVGDTGHVWSTNQSGQVRKFDVKTGTVDEVNPPIQWKQGDVVLATMPRMERILVRNELGISLLSTAEGKREEIGDPIRGETVHAAFSPSGGYVALVETEGLPNRNRIRVWNCNELKLVSEYSTKGVERVRAITVTNDGKSVYAVNAWSGVWRCDPEIIEAEIIVSSSGEFGETAVVFSGDGQDVVVHDGRGSIYRIQLRDGKPLWQAAAGPVKAMAFSPDGSLFVTALGPAVQVRDAMTGREQRLASGGGAPTAMRVARDGRTLVLLDHRAVQIWDLPERKHLARIERLPYVGRGDEDFGRLSADGEFLTSALMPDGPNGLWHLSTRQLVNGFVSGPIAVQSTGESHDTYRAWWLSATELRVDSPSRAAEWNTMGLGLGLGPSATVGTKPQLVIAADKLSLVDIAADNPQATTLERGYIFSGQHELRTKHRALATAANGHWFALRTPVVGGRQVVELWNLDLRIRMARYPIPDDWEIVQLSADGALLVVCETPRRVGRCAVWDAWTGIELARSDERGTLGDTANLWDGDCRIVFGMQDGTLRVAELFVNTRGKAIRDAGAKRADLDDAWQKLRSRHGADLVAAINLLCSMGDAGVDAIANRFDTRSVRSRAGSEQIAAWVAQLSGSSAAAASHQLLQASSVERAEIEKHLASNLPECVKTRLSLILAARAKDELTDDDLRLIRAMHVLRRIDSVAARAVLRRVADQASHDAVAHTARSVLAADKAVASQAIEFESGSLTRPRLGIAFWLPRHVMVIEPGSPAEKAGILVGDDIVRFAGVDIERHEQVVALLARQPLGSTVEVDVERKGERIPLKVEVR